MRIALLDPQHARAEHYRAVLASGGYRCHAFARIQPFLAATLRDTFDLAIVVGPAREPALRQALLALARRAAAPSVLMLAAQATEADMIDLLDAGVDDCLHEPAGEGWLLARTRALLRRGRAASPQDAAPTHFDGYRFDPVRCRVETPDATVALTPKELALALLLFRNQGRDLSRHYLVDGVWARESGPSSRSLDTHISRIRQKLSLHPEHGYQLTAIYSHGYRLDRATPAALPPVDERDHEKKRERPIPRTAIPAFLALPAPASVRTGSGGTMPVSAPVAAIALLPPLPPVPSAVRQPTFAAAPPFTRGELAHDEATNATRARSTGDPAR